VSSPEHQLRTAAWYGDRPLNLEFPREWDVSVLWPDTPPPITDEEIEAGLERPIGRPPIRELAAGCKRPVVIVDDLNRPTPAARVLPFVLRQLADAGVPPEQVSLVMGTGTHGGPPDDGMAKKVGETTAGRCRAHVHDSRRDGVRVGTTSFGTPVLVNPEVVDSDLVIGLGGVYPNHTAGFGGGSKTVLGVLGFRTIFTLHHGHDSVGWASEVTRSAFRRDLDEIATIVGLATAITVHVGPSREVVRVANGEPQRVFEDAVRFSRERYAASPPDDADVVVSNAYPGDLSLTFVRMKGIAPLQLAPERASRVVVAACPEGLGFHGLFPFLNAPRWHRQRHLAMRLAMLSTREIVHKVAGRVRRRLPGAAADREDAEPTIAPRRPMWLYRPVAEAPAHEADIPGMRETFSWGELLDAIRGEQAGRDRLRVVVYGCAPLQVLLDPEGRSMEAGEGE
jgi:lactate racemase